MTNRWHTENWTQLMSNSDELLTEIRQHAAMIDSAKVNELLRAADQQRETAAATFAAFGEQRHQLLETLDALQSELAVAGRPLTGEVS